jgi:outer membrane biosynthesis protein TonB
MTSEILQAELGDRHIIPEQSILRGTNCLQVLESLIQFATSIDRDRREHEVAVFSGQRIVKRTTSQAQVGRHFARPPPTPDSQFPPKREEPSPKPIYNPEDPPKPAPKHEEHPKPAPKREYPPKPAPKREDPPKPAPKREEPQKPAPKREEPPPKPAGPAPVKTSDGADPGPVFRKPTIADLKAAPAITLESDFASSSVRGRSRHGTRSRTRTRLSRTSRATRPRRRSRRLPSPRAVRRTRAMTST